MSISTATGYNAGSDSTQRPASILADLKPGGSEKDPASTIPGMPPNFGDFTIPHVVSFQGIISSVSRVYRPSDEAVKHSYDNARFMLNDASICECLEQRQRSAALLNWHLEPEDPRNPEQKQLAEDMTAILKGIPNFMQYREVLQYAIWYGKYGIQHRYRWQKIHGQMRIMPAEWKPINGDKIVFRYDDGTRQYDPNQVGIRVGAGYATGSTITGRWEGQSKRKIEPTDYGLAYFLEPWERRMLCIHKHRIEDGEYEDPQSAGRVHGVGIRSKIYWTWYQKQETLAWLMEFLERSAFGLEIWYYPYGNPEAELKTRTAAQERIGNGRNIILMPRPVEDMGQQYGVEKLETGMGGAEAVKSIVQEYFGAQLKRYILGQTLTTEAGSTGLGSNLATIHLDTYLQIVKYDATNQEETVTRELVEPLKRWNFPKYADVPLYFRIDTEAADVEGKLSGWDRAFHWGLKLKAEDVYAMIGASKPEAQDEILQDPTIQQQQRLWAQHMAGGPMPGMPGMPGAEGMGAGGAGGAGAGGAPVDPAQQEADRQGAADEMWKTVQTGQLTDELGLGGISPGDKPVPSENSERQKVADYAKAWDESKHPRGKPENKGEFTESNSEEFEPIPGDILKRYATTWREAGFIAPDGTLLGKQGRHRDMLQALGADTDPGREGNSPAIGAKFGLVRAWRSATELSIQFHAKPTSSQLDELVEQANTTLLGQLPVVMVEVTDKRGKTHGWKRWAASDPRPTKDELMAVFRDTQRPKSKSQPKEPTTSLSSKSSLHSFVVDAINRNREDYAKKPAPGQKNLFREEDHPRDDEGKFAEKEEAAKPAGTGQDWQAKLAEAKAEEPAGGEKKQPTVPAAMDPVFFTKGGQAAKVIGRNPEAMGLKPGTLPYKSWLAGYDAATAKTPRGGAGKGKATQHEDLSAIIKPSSVGDIDTRLKRSMPLDYKTTNYSVEAFDALPKSVQDFLVAHASKQRGIARHHGFDLNDFDLKLRKVPIDQLQPTQHGEDYNNASSEETAIQIKRGLTTALRLEDLAPLLVHDNDILDGNHRHAASVRNQQKEIYILDMIPKSKKSPYSRHSDRDLLAYQLCQRYYRESPPVEQECFWAGGAGSITVIQDNRPLRYTRTSRGNVTVEKLIV